jgi:hypothetical protein
MSCGGFVSEVATGGNSSGATGRQPIIIIQGPTAGRQQLLRLNDIVVKQALVNPKYGKAST